MILVTSYERCEAFIKEFEQDATNEYKMSIFKFNNQGMLRFSDGKVKWAFDIVDTKIRTACLQQYLFDAIESDEGCIETVSAAFPLISVEEVTERLKKVGLIR